MAYAKTGVLKTTKPRIKSRPPRRSPHADFGVVFVHGIGADASQFRGIRRALKRDVSWFDAFEYNWRHPMDRLARDLHEHLEAASEHVPKVMIVGHSLGGVLSRMVLQDPRPPVSVAGFVSICAPLHGTTRSRLAPVGTIRNLAPDSALMTELRQTTDRLERYKDRILTISARTDQFVAPAAHAHLDGHAQLVLDRVGHVGSLFDEEVYESVRDFARRIRQHDPL